MNQNRRIILNIAATYGRSLYALVVGLFTGRWVLMSLGPIDYGLFGVVGGLTVFVTMINQMLTAGASRFYAVSVGAAAADVSNNRATEECREWFTAGLLIHSVLPVLLVGIGYPIGCWAVREFLDIPADRLQSCIWVWRFVCVSCLIGLISAPFSAMYAAKQEIAELTLYSFATTTLNFIFVYYMVSHPGFWLSRYALWTSLTASVPMLCICVRAIVKYPECRIRFNWKRCRRNALKMMSYSGWSSIGTFADVLNSQGNNILVNKYFGASVNAAMSVGNTMSGHCATLSGSMVGAFWPAIMNAYGAGQHDFMRRMAYRVCKIATLLVLIFAIPLSLEVDEILRLWLKDPPTYAAGLCISVLLVQIFDKVGYGFPVVAQAIGKVARYQTISGIVCLIGLPLAWFSVAMGGSVYWVGAAMAVTRFARCISNVYATRKISSMSVSFWMKRIVVPLFVLSGVSVVAGVVPRLFLEPSFMRICITTVVVESCMFLFSWKWLLDKDEQVFVSRRIQLLFSDIGLKGHAVRT